MNLIKQVAENPNSKLTTGFTIIVSILACGFSFAIGRSRNVSVDALGMSLTTQVVKDNEALDKCLFLVDHQRKAQDRVYQEAREFTRRYPAGLQLLQEAERARGAIPSQEIKKLEQSLQESEEVIESLDEY